MAKDHTTMCSRTMTPRSASLKPTRESPSVPQSQLQSQSLLKIQLSGVAALKTIGLTIRIRTIKETMITTIKAITTTFLTVTGMTTMTKRTTIVATEMKTMIQRMTKNQAATKKHRRTVPKKMSSTLIIGKIIRAQ